MSDFSYRFFCLRFLISQVHQRRYHVFEIIGYDGLIRQRGGIIGMINFILSFSSRTMRAAVFFPMPGIEKSLDSSEAMNCA